MGKMTENRQIWGKVYEKWPKFWVKIDKCAPFVPKLCRSNFKFFLCVEMFLKCLWSKFEEFWTIYVPEQILWISVAYVFVLWRLSLRKWNRRSFDSWLGNYRRLDFLKDFLENSEFESGSCNQINHVNVNTFEKHYIRRNTITKFAKKKSAFVA